MKIKYRKNDSWKFFNLEFEIENISQLDNAIKLNLSQALSDHNNTSKYIISDVDIIETHFNIVEKTEEGFYYQITLGCAIVINSENISNDGI